MRDNDDESEDLNQVRTRQSNRKYKDFYQYYGEIANKFKSHTHQMKHMH